jgi:hypothetical protein
MLHRHTVLSLLIRHIPKIDLMEQHIVFDKFLTSQTYQQPYVCMHPSGDTLYHVPPLECTMQGCTILHGADVPVTHMAIFYYSSDNGSKLSTTFTNVVFYCY